MGDAAAIWFLPVTAEGGAVGVDKMPVGFAPRVSGFTVPEFGVIALVDAMGMPSKANQAY